MWVQVLAGSAAGPCASCSLPVLTRPYGRPDVELDAIE